MDDITITDVRAVPGDSAFLIHNEKCAILYDSGFAFSGVAVLDNIKQVLGDRLLDFILLTHSHYDHVLGVPNLLEAYPNVKVVASAYAAHIFTRASAKQTMRELNKKAAQHLGLPPKDHLIEKLRVDIPVKDGDIIDCADLRFRVIALPGHTKCSVGYYLEENNLLLGVETLGVYFGNNTYLPSSLVGYQMTLDSFHKVKQLNIEKILLPHYGVVEKEDAKNALAQSEAVTRDVRQQIITMFQNGKTNAEMLAYFTERDYKENVRPTYPIDAFLLNTEIMIELVRREYLEERKNR